MPTLRQIKSRFANELIEAGIDAHEAGRECQLIIEECCGLTLAKQFLADDEPVDQEKLQRAEAIISQRKKRVPLQYLLGYTHFMGLRFNVRPGVLIPRQDTEVLVETVLRFLQSRGSARIIDIGTGSGAIVVSLLKLLPNCSAVGIDISETAIAVAAENAVAHGVSSRLDLMHVSVEEFFARELFDVVVSNPPYVASSLESELQPEVRVFEPKEAVFGADQDGLGLYRLISSRAGQFLKRPGFIALEVGQGQSETVAAILETDHWSGVAVHADLNNIPRVVTALAET